VIINLTVAYPLEVRILSHNNIKQDKTITNNNKKTIKGRGQSKASAKHSLERPEGVQPNR